MIDPQEELDSKNKAKLDYFDIGHIFQLVTLFWCVSFQTLNTSKKSECYTRAQLSHKQHCISVSVFPYMCIHLYIYLYIHACIHKIYQSHLLKNSCMYSIV